MEDKLLTHPGLDFFKSNHRVYYIATGEFIQQSNGFRVPFYLCHILNELGFEAYVTAREQAPNLRTPLLTPEINAKHLKDGREIISIYTEAMWGNILRGDIVVRWILNRIGLLFDSGQFPDEMFFYWNKSYSANDHEAKDLKVPCIDPEIFFDNPEKQQKREGFAYYAHKYIRDFGKYIPEDIRNNGISLCHDVPRTHQEIAEILRNVNVLYCFEDSSIILEAVACGCTVVFIKSAFTPYVHRKSEFIDYVVDIEDFDINTVVKNTGSAHADFIKYSKMNMAGIVDFILSTQQVKKPDIKPRDPFLHFIEKYDLIYIYGIGLTADVVYNTLISAGFTVSGFIVSDEYYNNNNQVKLGLPVIPLSNFIKSKPRKSGVLTAMLYRHVEQVMPLLLYHGIDVYNPVLF